MKEEYKTCPNCHNMVDKKDKQCPYCLTSLTRRSMGNTSNRTNNSSTRETQNSTTKDKEYNSYEESNSGNEEYNENSDTIRDDNKKNKEILGNNLIPTIKIYNTQLEKKLLGRGNDQNIDPEMIKKIRRFTIIFFLIIRIPMLIGMITGFFGD